MTPRKPPSRAELDAVMRYLLELHTLLDWAPTAACPRREPIKGLRLMWGTTKPTPALGDSSDK